MKKRIIREMFQLMLPEIPAVQKKYAGSRIKKRMSHLLSADIVKRCEDDFELKKKEVASFSQKENLTYKEIKKQCEDIISRAPLYKSLEAEERNDLVCDMIFCEKAYGFPPDEYLCYELENKGFEERSSFVSDVERVCYIHRTNSLRGLRLFTNKALTYQKFKRYFQRDAAYIKYSNDYSKFRQFTENHEQFVKKEVFEGKGNSIELVNSSDADKEYFNKLIKIGPHIIEERVIQCSAMAKLNESSVNTVRVITLLTKQGVRVAYTFLKTGRKGSFVDNGGAGGILVGIDKRSGCLDSDGVDELNIKYEVHPDSGVRFKGYQLPEWDSLLRLSKKLSLMVPDVKFIGWDFAHTDKGWVVIEGNASSQLIGPQTIYKIGLKKEMERYLSQMDLIV